MEKKIKIKNNWSEISVGEYIELVSILRDEELDEVEVNNYILSILSGLEVREIRALELNSFKELLKSIHFLRTEPTSKIRKSYNIDGVEYMTTLRLDKVTTGQYMDLQAMATNPDSILENMSKILAVFLIPKGKKYGEYDVLEVANIIDSKFMIEDAYALTFFFSTLNQKLLKCSQDYLISMKKKAEKKLKKK